MIKKLAALWYLLEWKDRDKCLLLVAFFGLLELFYWGGVDLVAHFTYFGHFYFSPPGLNHAQLVFAACTLVWAGLFAWGLILHRRQQESIFYVRVSLYIYSLPLLVTGNLIGLYNPLLGLVLLGSVLTGAILFDFRRIIGPFVGVVVLLSLLAWSIVNWGVEYAPLLRIDPVSKLHVSGVWIFLIMIAASPFVLGVLLVTYLLLARWHERERTIRQLSYIDPLTGLANRRALFMQMEHQLEYSRRTQEPLAVAMLDLDHFKQVNDSWGHAAGDQVLREVGALLPRLLRRADLMGRVGGEEFVIVLPRAPADAAYQVLERCRAAIEALPIVLADGRCIRITASFGLCTCEVPSYDIDLQQILESADSALYRAKHRGRNRIEMLPLTVEGPSP